MVLDVEADNFVGALPVAAKKLSGSASELMDMLASGAIEVKPARQAKAEGTTSTGAATATTPTPTGPKRVG